MSTTFVLADNQKWYEQPIIGEAKRWFICFDFETPLEMHIRIMRKILLIPRMEIYMEAPDLVKRFNLPIIIKSQKTRGDCLYPDGDGYFSGKMMQTAIFKIEMTGPVPSELLLSFRNFFIKRPNGEGVYYDGSIKV